MCLYISSRIGQQSRWRENEKLIRVCSLGFFSLLFTLQRRDTYIHTRAIFYQIHKCFNFKGKLCHLMFSRLYCSGYNENLFSVWFVWSEVCALCGMDPNIELVYFELYNWVHLLLFNYRDRFALLMRSSVQGPLFNYKIRLYFIDPFLLFLIFYQSTSCLNLDMNWIQKDLSLTNLLKLYNFNWNSFLGEPFIE